MNFRKKFGGITITRVREQDPSEWLGGWYHRQKTPEPPMYASVLPLCLRERKDDPLTERKDLPQLPVWPYTVPPVTPTMEVRSDRDGKKKAQNAKGKPSRKPSGNPSRKRRGGRGAGTKPVRRKR